MRIFNIPIGSDKKDARRHGNFDFPVAVYDTSLESLSSGFINWHWHDEMHFYVVKSGYIAFHAGAHVFKLRKGEGVFVNCGCIHMIRPIDRDADNSIITIFAHPKLLSTFQGSVVEHKYVKPYIEGDNLTSVALNGNEAWQQVVLKKLGRIYEICAAEPYHTYELDVVIEWLSVWKQMIMNVSIEKKTKSDGGMNNEKIKTILEFINKRFTGKITLDEIASEARLSRNECCRFFKRTVNCTLFSYIMDCRINKGIELLKKTDKSVKEIAFEAGFDDVSYFITSFKKKTGYTPKSYKNIANTEVIR